MIKGRLSLEAIVLGRNDDYEPNWANKLVASIAYNHARFSGSAVDYTVCFVEWNPPRDRPLLTPSLIQRFPYLRGIVVDADVHDKLCTSPKLNMMLNFALNCGLRTSSADFNLISAGDLFIGSTIASYIRGVGLAHNCLYRAERVNISPELDFSMVTPADIEATQNIISINSCTEPPFDKPPYTHACGDFLLTDRLTMLGLRGFDESVRSARLHLDSRFCFTAMTADLSCNLIGQIFHINHTNSYTVLGEKYPDVRYQWDGDLPYLNPRDWGLADHNWEQGGERYWHVRPPAGGKPTIPARLSPAEIEAADAVTRRIITRKREIRPDAPRKTAKPLASARLADLTARGHWINSKVYAGAPTLVVTASASWGYSAVLNLTPLLQQHRQNSGWHFLEIDAEVEEGDVGIGVGLVDRDLIIAERFIEASQGLQKIFLPIEMTDAQLIVRNGRNAGSSRVAFHSIRFVHEPALDQAEYEARFLLGA